MWKGIKKFVFSIMLLALVLPGSNYLYVSAAEEEIEENTKIVLASNTSAYTAGTNVGIKVLKPGKAKISAQIMGKLDASCIKATIILQKYNKTAGRWIDRKRWVRTKKSSAYSFHKVCRLGKNGVYRAKLSATVWKDGKSETISHASASVICKDMTNSNVDFLLLNGNTARILARVMGKTGTSKVKATLRLQKYDKTAGKWKNRECWVKTKKSSANFFEKNCQLKEKGIYRVKLSATMWRKGRREYITYTSAKVYY